MAAYATLTSLLQILDQLELHTFPPITLDKQQAQSLTEILTLLQEFLERYDSPFTYSDEVDPLEMRIADVAYAAEDVIASYTVDSFLLRRSTSTHHPSFFDCFPSFFNCFRGCNNEAANDHDVGGEVRLWNNFYKDVQRVIKDMNLIKKEAMREKNSAVQAAHSSPQRNIFMRSSSLTGKKSSSTTSTIMVGFGDVLMQLLGTLTGGSLNLQVIPITGMGGIGKTTLARYIFQHALIKDHFDICVWITISQQYNTKEIICQILSQVTGSEKSDVVSEMSEEEILGVELHKYLYGRRYLIIMDDVWDIDVWEKMSSYFVDSNNGSRIIVTTRQSYLTPQLSSSDHGLDLSFLDEVNSWDLFSKTVFGDASFPLPLEKIGKKIVERCRGLPLSIVVIGGLLAKSDHTQEYWEHIEQKLSSIVNSENDEYCMKLLKLSYDNLPAYLKPCFLHMGSFEEDRKIRVSKLIKLWVSEGFLKPENGKSLETIGKGFLKDLIDRNLILIDELGSIGGIKFCKMHDLLRDLSLKEGEKERFYHVIGQCTRTTPHSIHNQGRTIYPRNLSSNERYMHLDSLQKSMSQVRSLTFNDSTLRVMFPNSRVLRISNASYHRYYLDDVTDELVKSWYLDIRIHSSTKLSSSVSFLWYLQTLRIVNEKEIVAPVEIWKMSQLRHVEFYRGVGMHLPDPPSGNSSSVIILENLESLKGVVNFKCGEEVVKRIPNIKKLKIRSVCGDHKYSLNNLECLRKLESFTCNEVQWNDVYVPNNITFPHSLIKLTLGSSKSSIGWEEMLENIGLLPLLQKLTLIRGVFKTGKWETVEGRFPSLKYFKMQWCRGLKQWTVTESSHFPCLEKLYLYGLRELEEIPAAIGEIPTLQSIELFHCSESAVKSAKKIVEEQEELQGEDQLSFHVKVVVREEKDYIALQTMAAPNFIVELLH